MVVGGEDRVVTKYNPRTNTWRNVQSLQQKRYGCSICTLDQKIFVLGGLDNTCEMLDLSDDDPQWRSIGNMSMISGQNGCAVVIERKIYVLGGNNKNVDVYDVDQGIVMEYLHIVILNIYRSVEHSYHHANSEIGARCSCT